MNTLAQRKAALKARIDEIDDAELLEIVEDVLAEKTAPELSPEQLAELERRANSPTPRVALSETLEAYQEMKNSRLENAR